MCVFVQFSTVSNVLYILLTRITCQEKGSVAETLKSEFQLFVCEREGVPPISELLLKVCVMKFFLGFGIGLKQLGLPERAVSCSHKWARRMGCVIWIWTTCAESCFSQFFFLKMLKIAGLTHFTDQSFNIDLQTEHVQYLSQDIKFTLDPRLVIASSNSFALQLWRSAIILHVPL